MLGDPEDRSLLSSGEAAALVGLSKPTLLRAVQRGWLAFAYHTPGGHFRFRREDLERFRREHLGWEAQS